MKKGTCEFSHKGGSKKRHEHPMCSRPEGQSKHLIGELPRRVHRRNKRRKMEKMGIVGK
jgi:hypothetical protein